MNYPFRAFRKWVLVFWVSALSSSVGSGFMGFSLPSETGSAKLILHGRLDSDGKFVTQKVLKGKVDEKDSIPILGGKEIYRKIQETRSQPGTIEVVLYLGERNKEGYPLADRARGVVFFHNEDVYLATPQRDRLHFEISLSRSLSWKRTTFLDDAQKMIIAQKLRDDLLAQKPSPNRIRNLVQFLHAQPEIYFFDHLYEIRYRVRCLGKEEEQALLELFQKSDFPARLDLLLPVLMLTPKSPKAFDTACIYLDYQHSSRIRQSAMDALIKIDEHQGQIKLANYLHFAEPEIDKIIHALSPDSRFKLNSQIVEPILTYTQAVRQLHRSAGKQVLLDESHRLIGLLSQYEHPKMVLALFEWAATDHTTNGNALFSLQRMLDVRWDDEPLVQAKAWLKKVKPFLEADYNLKTKKGLSQWFDAYKQVDPGTRKFLLRLWGFEPTIDEKALLEAASQKETQEAAQAVLRELWDHDRLPHASRKAILEKFLRIELVEVSSTNGASGNRELQIVAHRSFPFPAHLRVEKRFHITIGDQKPTLMGGQHLNFDGLGKIVLGSLKSGSDLNSSKAQAILHLYENKYDGEKIGIYWEKEWTLGPIQLKKINKSIETSEARAK